MLEPLDVSVFAPLKRAVSWLDYGRIQRVEWTGMYIRAREKALAASNVISGWRATGLELLSQTTVLEKLSAPAASQPLPPCTPALAHPIFVALHQKVQN